MRGPNGLITAAPPAQAIHQVGTHSKMENLIVLGATALITQHALPSLATWESLSFSSSFPISLPFCLPLPPFSPTNFPSVSTKEI